MKNIWLDAINIGKVSHITKIVYINFYTYIVKETKKKPKTVSRNCQKAKDKKNIKDTP